MGIVDEDIARVRAATDFVGLVSEHLALKRVGLRWIGLCPFHTEKSPSFSVNAEEGLYYCFGCQARGDAITFVREIEQLDFAEAVEKLAGRVGIALRYDNDDGGREHQRLRRVHETLAAAVAWYHDQLLSAREHGAGNARHYLRHERGYDADVVRRYQLGWAPDGWDHLVRALRLPAAALVDAGLATLGDRERATDFFRGRLLFPIFDPSGRPIGAGGRILPGGRGPKYKNTSGTAVYDKSRVLYGLNWAKGDIARKDRVVVCEGYTDVIGLQLAGIGEAVATCGTALADGHVRLLTKYARRIVLAYDADAAGQSAADRFYAWEQRFDADIRVAALPGGSDPADLARSDPAALERAIDGARPFLSFQLERLFARADLASAEGRAKAATEAVGYVRTHPNELVRDQYLMEIADRCRLSPDRLRTLPATPPPSPEASSRSRGPRHGDEPPPARVHPQVSDGPPVPGAELIALRLAVHDPGSIADRIEAVLFSHATSRAAFDALAAADTLGDAIADAVPVVADLLNRLAVEECDEDPDDVMVRLVETAGKRAQGELHQEMRAAAPPDQASYAASVGWLKLTVEALRTPDGTAVSATVDPELGAERRLVAWLVARSQADGGARDADLAGVDGAGPGAAVPDVAVPDVAVSDVAVSDVAVGPPLVEGAGPAR